MVKLFTVCVLPLPTGFTLETSKCFKKNLIVNRYITRFTDSENNYIHFNFTTMINNRE